MSRNTKRIDWVEMKRRLAMRQEAIDRGLVQSDQRIQEIFHQRSLDLARRQSGQWTKAGCRTLICALGAEKYCLELASLSEILPFGKCTPVPGAPPELLGLINLRGEIRSVISLSRLLRLDSADSDEQAGGYVAMLRSGRVEVGLRVDAVERVAVVSLDSLSLPENDGMGSSQGYVRGVTPDGLIMLNHPAILSHPMFTGHDSESMVNGTV